MGARNRGPAARWSWTRAWWAVMLALLACHAVSPVAAQPGPGRGPGWTDLGQLLRMNQTEELTESFANSMIDMAAALRERRHERALPWLAESFEGDLPFGGPVVDAVLHEGFVRSTFGVPPGPKVGREAWLDALRRRTESWRDVEDARFKVTDAGLEGTDPAQGDAKVKMEIQGWGPGGERRAITLMMQSRVWRRGGKWMWRSTEIVSATELRAPGGRAGESGAGTPAPEPASGGRSSPPLELVSRRAGIADNAGDYRPERRIRGPESLGQGAAALDIDADGLMDLFVPAEPANRLYRNKGDGTFEDVASAWGVAEPSGGTGAIALDFDNDGLPDLFKCFASYEGAPVASPLVLWRNVGGRFEDISREAGVQRTVCAVSAAAGDYDGDGLLDIYVCCVEDGERLRPYPQGHATNAEPNLLFHNLGQGRFEEVGAQAGVDDTRWSFTAAWSDFDSDGWLDLFVVNDRGDKTLYRNTGGGRFEEVAARMGVVDTGAGMGGSWGDHDGDGLLDFYASNMYSTAGNRILRRIFPRGGGGDVELLMKFVKGNSLLRWNGTSFENRTEQAGLGNAGWAWGNAFLDIDNDGWLDVFVANGNKSGETKKDT